MTKTIPHHVLLEGSHNWATVEQGHTATLVGTLTAIHHDPSPGEGGTMTLRFPDASSLTLSCDTAMGLFSLPLFGIVYVMALRSGDGMEALFAGQRGGKVIKLTDRPDIPSNIDSLVK